MKHELVRPDDVARRRAMFIDEIARWSRKRRDAEGLSREELSQLEGFERLLALRHSLLDNIAHYLRRHPSADAALGVLALVTYLSDNTDGCSTISVDRMAAFLARDPRRIRDAIARLEKASCITVLRRNGSTSQAYPRVLQVFASTNIPITWQLDARAPRQTQATPDASVTPDTNVTLTALTNSPDAGVSPPLTRVSPNTTNTNTTNDTPPNSGFAIDEAIQSFNSAASNFGFTKCGMLTKARRTRLGKRLADLGGLDNFRAAMRGLSTNDPFAVFLRGEAAPRPGDKPFKLDIDRLLQTEGNLGDVLARLLDLGDASTSQAGAKAPPWWLDASAAAAMTLDQWRRLITQHVTGRVWPIREVGPAPGSPRCVIPPEIIAEFKLAERFDDRGVPRFSWASIRSTG